jgi:hypothetical protein
MTFVRLAAALVLTALAAAPAVAVDQFNSSAPGCVPGDPAMRFNRYVIADGTVKHRSGAVGLITLYCNIPTAITPPKTLELIYSDDDSGADTFVRASYIKMRKATGAITTVATTISNQGRQDGAVHFVEQRFNDAYDPKRHLYYVRVDIDRKVTSKVAVFYGVTVY